jgi:DinB family protein
MSEKEQYLATFEREYPVTLNVLRAFPHAKTDLKPHQRSKTAKELAWNFVFEGYAGLQGVDGEMPFPPKGMPAQPATWDGVVGAVEGVFKQLGDKVRKASDADLNKTVKFFAGPKKMADIRRLDLLWFLMMDMIHHRGQMSVYLRMADGKVPSIYGPTADEPWD